MAYEVCISTQESAALIAVRASNDGRSVACEALGFELPQPGTSTGKGDRRAFALARDEWLLAVPGAHEAAVFGVLDQVFANGGGAVSVVSDAYVCTRVSGPEAADVMAQVVPIDLHPAAFRVDSARRTAFGRASALVHRLGEPPGFDIYVDRTLARYAARLLAVCSGAESALST